MKHFELNTGLPTKHFKSTCVFISFISIFIIGLLLGTNLEQARRNLYTLSLSVVKSYKAPSLKSNPVTSTVKSSPSESTFQGYNSTHLWSMRLADENYFRLAKTIPCRTVEYAGGPQIDRLNSCDYSSTNEFSIRNTLRAQQWLYEHQNPVNCSNKRFAIIQNYAWSGFGSTIHQIVWAFGMALADNRIAVYQVPGNWLYGDCSAGTPDCIFLPITNCSLPTKVDGNQTIAINANFGHWSKPIHPVIFQNRTFNWYRSQLLFYIMRFNKETLAHVQNTVMQYFKPPSVDLIHPYIAVYVRRSDKVQNKEMSQAYSLKQYFDLFDAHARQANVTNVYINSEDSHVFDEFSQLYKNNQSYYRLFSITAERNIVFRTLVSMPRNRRGKIVLEFLSDLFIEVNADLHVGTLTSNWCRLVDEIRLVLGKIMPYYTPENRYLLDW